MASDHLKRKMLLVTLDLIAKMEAIPAPTADELAVIDEQKAKKAELVKELKEAEILP